MSLPNNWRFLVQRFFGTLSFLAIVAAAQLALADAPKLNVLFIAVDDLRPQLGCYGDSVVESPNIDRLAGRGLVFSRAYCQQAVCCPSRASVLTGLRPDSTRVFDNGTHFRTANRDVVTLPQHFKQHGYSAQAFGKIYHPGYGDAPSWSTPHWYPKASSTGPESQALIERLRAEALAAGKDLTKPVNRIQGRPFEACDVPDNALADGATADRVIEALRELRGQPFFVAAGFLRPHLPFVAPRKYWDLYSPADIKLASNPQPPRDVSPIALHEWSELRRYHGMPKSGPVPSDDARRLVHGYLASISYLDAQVGRVLDELDKLDLRDKTVVVLWGDHGWQLGEHGLWCKHSNFERATRAPLIISAPGQKSAGEATRALVEFVDIYPTLAELCGLPAPMRAEGTTLTPLLENPNRTWKTAAFSQYPRKMADGQMCMGYSVRTDRWRYTEWDEGRQGRELYDHDADSGENVNLATDPKYAATVKELSGLLKK